MLEIAIRNIRRQKTRSFLTILGIVIGIGAIVALGSISEGMNIMFHKNMELIAGKIMVIEKDGGGTIFGFMGSEITEEGVDSVREVSGVKDVAPMLFYMEGNGGGMMVPDWWVIGLEPEKNEYWKGENIQITEGRDLEEGETEVALLGKDVSDKLNLEVGDYITVKDVDFEIVGIIEKSDINDIDRGVIVPLEDLKDILETETYHFVYVIPDDITEVENVAADIEDANEDLDTMTSTDITRQAGQMLGQIQLFAFGIGAIAAIVGGLGIMNTMIMAVMERRREIGIMKAIGATNRTVLLQFLTESALLSFIGGCIGIGLGGLVALVINILTGFFITAAVTPLLVGIGLGFALFLGIVGGFYPAWKAAKLDPVEALRYE